MSHTVDSVRPIPSANAIERHLTVREVADFLGVGKSTVYRLLEAGELPYLRIGKSARRIPASVLRAYIDTHLVKRS